MEAQVIQGLNNMSISHVMFILIECNLLWCPLPEEVVIVEKKPHI